MTSKPESKTLALINGQKVHYDYACPTRYSVKNGAVIPSYPNLVYLGVGTVHSIDGVEQLGDMALHFWSKQPARQSEEA